MSAFWPLGDQPLSSKCSLKRGRKKCRAERRAIPMIWPSPQSWILHQNAIKTSLPASDPFSGLISPHLQPLSSANTLGSPALRHPGLYIRWPSALAPLSSFSLFRTPFSVALSECCAGDLNLSLLLARSFSLMTFLLRLCSQASPHLLP